MTKLILFVSTESIVSKLAEIVFTIEAEKNEVIWQASARVAEGDKSYAFLPDAISDDSLTSVGVESKEAMEACGELSRDELASCDLVIELKLPGQEEVIKNEFDNKLDVWRLNNDVVEELKLYVSNLMVRLIMQGGRRAPVDRQSEPIPGATSGANKKEARVRVFLDKKKRRGKKVTTISGLPLAEKEMYELAAKLKQLCGSGGTVKDGCIEVQGDKCDQILNELTKLGYKPKRSGG